MGAELFEEMKTKQDVNIASVLVDQQFQWGAKPCLGGPEVARAEGDSVSAMEGGLSQGEREAGGRRWRRLACSVMVGEREGLRQQRTRPRELGGDRRGTPVSVRTVAKISHTCAGVEGRLFRASNCWRTGRPLHTGLELPGLRRDTHRSGFVAALEAQNNPGLEDVSGTMVAGASWEPQQPSWNTLWPPCAHPGA